LKILVISDSHNVILDSMIEAVKKEGPFDLLIHCGDKYDDAGRFAQKLNMRKVLKVPGNCDYNYNILGTKANIMQEIEGRKFLITHGHTHHVKTDLTKIRAYAKKNKALIKQTKYLYPLEALKSFLFIISPIYRRTFEGV
jgi:putative phosphoesterase